MSDGTTETYILCELAGATYGIPSRVVQHVEMIEQVTPVPNAPAALDGVIFSRGQVIPALNLRKRFGFAPLPYDLRTRLVVVASGGRTVGLVVDTAREFAAIAHNTIEPPPSAVGHLSGNYLEGIATLNGRLVLVLRLDDVLHIADALVPTSDADQGEAHDILFSH